MIQIDILDKIHYCCCINILKYSLSELHVKRPNNPDDVDNDDSDSTTTTIDVYSALSECESQSE